MAIPDFQSFFKPLLDLASDGQEHSMADARTQLVKTMQMSPGDLAVMLPSGKQRTFDSRVEWAKSYLVQARALEASKRAHFRITDRGKELLTRHLDRIDISILNEFPEFVEFHTAGKGGDDGEPKPPVPTELTPEETLQQAYRGIRNELAADLLSRVKANTPEFFERLVVELMVAMGYGGSIVDAGQAVGRSGDEGIDGIIKEDRLGLDIIYIQAKKWEGSVGRPEIQRFVGALHGKRARKGVFITTGKFSEEASGYVESIDPKVVMIDGKALANYMIDFNLGVARSTTYEVKRIDSDFFAEE